MKKTKEYNLTLIKPNEVDRSVETMIKAGVRGILSNKEFLRRAMVDTESTITIVAKKNDEFFGVINGIAIKRQRINPQITFVWVKDRESSMKGLPKMLIDKFQEEAKKRKPETRSIEVNLPALDLNSITLYSMNDFVVEGFVKGAYGSADVVIMRKSLDKKASRPSVA